MLRKKPAAMATPDVKSRTIFRKIFLTVWAAMILFSVFSLGWGVGKGRIKFGNGIATITTKTPSGNLDYSSVDSVYSVLKENFDGDLDDAKLLDGIKQGLAKATDDPYTEYFNEEGAKEFNEELSGSFVGIGAELGKDNDSIIVVSPISGFPAEKAGLKPRDIIIEIDGKTTYDITVGEAVKRIRGEKGTKVTLKVLRDGKDQITIEIVRDQITIPSVETKTLDGDIGYIKISRFSEDTTGLVTAAAKSFKSAGVKGIVLDMRSNPGGLLESAVDVSSLWLKDKLIVDERRSGKTIKTYKSRGETILADMKTVALIDGGSASASEIVAGALHDHNAATLVGEKSFGKGSVQSLECLANNSLFGGGGQCKGPILKVTIARWYTPAGKNIDKEGIEPDNKVALNADDFKAGIDAQLNTALTLLK